MRRSIQSAQRKVRMIAVRLEGSTGTLSVEGLDAKQVSITDNGVGDYTITFNEAFAEAPHVSMAAEATGIMLHASSITASAVRIICKLVDQDATYAAPAAAEADVQVIIVGHDITENY
jgi:hypothetical protein